MTNAELQALELQARIMGWAPATVWDCIVEVPGPSGVIVGYQSTLDGWKPIYAHDAAVQEI